MTQTTTTTRGGNQSSKIRDDRGFYRKALAIAAPVPMLAMGLIYLLTKIPQQGDFGDMVEAAGRQADLLNALVWPSLLFFGLLIPAVIAVAAVTRRTSPRLTIVGICLTVPGFAVGFGGGVNDNLFAYVTYTEGLDVETIGKLDEALWAMPQTGVASLLFIVGIVIGLLLLGIALAKSQAVPVFFGVALAFGGFTHPFMPTHVLAAIGLFVAALGFAGASLALWRMRDDEFALPPTR